MEALLFWYYRIGSTIQFCENHPVLAENVLAGKVLARKVLAGNMLARRVLAPFLSTSHFSDVFQLRMSDPDPTLLIFIFCYILDTGLH
jgi:hypothetical protein